MLHQPLLICLLSIFTKFVFSIQYNLLIHYILLVIVFVTKVNMGNADDSSIRFVCPGVADACIVLAGIHLCCWGRVDPGKGSAVDMTIGLPKPSLLPLGLGDLPDDYVLTIPVRGNSQQPDVDFGR